MADRIERLVTVARLYHEVGLTQQQVADRLGINRSSISRLLTEARDRGIIEIRIRVPTALDDGRSAALVERYPVLTEARVVRPVGSGDRYPALGRAGAEVLRELVTDRSTVGVTWGRSLAAVVEAVEPAGPSDSPSDVQVVQLMGAAGMGQASARAIVDGLATTLGGHGVLLDAPLLVDEPAVAAALVDDASIRPTLDLARRADVALIGVGAIADPDATLLVGGHLGRAEIHRLARAGAVGDAGGHLIDRAGRPVAGVADRLIGLDRDGLLAIPERLVVAGGAAKATAVAAALTAGFATRLITDVALADALLDGG